MTEELTIDAAFDALPDDATEVASEVESAPEVEADAPATEPETKPEEAPETAKEVATDENPDAEPEVEPEPDSELADALAGLDHEEVRKSVPFKGLLSEVQKLREENRTLKEAKAVPAAEVPDEDADDDTDDDADVFTAADVKKIVARELAREVAPLRQQIDGTSKAARQVAFQTGLDALRADQKAGNIPTGVNTDAIVRKALSELQESKPAVLADLLEDINPVKSIYHYATTRIPAIADDLATAAKTQEQVQKERLAKGRSPTGDSPSQINDMLDVLSNRD